MLAEHGGAQAALAALPDVARAAGVTTYRPVTIDEAGAEMDAARRVGARMLCWGAPDYPVALMDLPDAPPVLWAIGDLARLTQPLVALVGARNASSLGLRMARRLAAALGEAGFGIVSGLARGIDAAAHEAALPSGTVAVQAGGVDVIYPRENGDLAREIAARGCRLSEQPIGAAPQARHFPTRNRLVSGLARVVVVVEAATRSGSLMTARAALDQGREVLAVPGHPFDARAGGCNQLIRDGATLVRGAEDVLELLAPALADAHRAARLGVADADRGAESRPAAKRDGDGTGGGDGVGGEGGRIPHPRPPRPANPELREAAALHRAILDRLGPSPVAEDQLIRDLALPAAQIAPELLTLELEGRVQRQPGGLLSRMN
ncbi:DNA processing protein DprA [Defluviimonas sp. 20V17]|uniref:DNA processing protein DprA n=1 Tax=Allgaiera indica TaxID=765699 RepID=A0AAN4US97_9RHOB|nr:DNA processing protein DprA [Defluviimonas sp. 20V17]GHE01940.1 DNA processing protein DprA [Allgaiera indica]